MKVALVGYGRRGDVQPFVCLGAGLAERGHDVVVVVPRNGAPMARAAGLAVCELPLDVQEMFSAPAAQRMLAAGRITAFFRWLHAQERAYLDELRATLVDGTAGAEVIVCHPLVEDRCAAIAQAYGAAILTVQSFPLLPSGTFPSAFITTRNAGPLNRATHRLMLAMLWRLSRGDVARLRRELGIAPASESQTRAIATVRAALTSVERRGILAAGWTRLAPAQDDRLLTVERIDHQALMPICAATVHHGGAGTVHAGFAAGTPTLVCSVFADQPFWGARGRALGVGDTLPFKRLGERRLTASLRAVLAPDVVARARELAVRMAAERPLDNAIEMIEGCGTHAAAPTLAAGLTAHRPSARTVQQ